MCELFAIHALPVPSPGPTHAMHELLFPVSNLDISGPIASWQQLWFPSAIKVMMPRMDAKTSGGSIQHQLRPPCCPRYQLHQLCWRNQRQSLGFFPMAPRGSRGKLLKTAVASKICGSCCGWKQRPLDQFLPTPDFLTTSDIQLGLTSNHARYLINFVQSYLMLEYVGITLDQCKNM